MEYEKCYAFEPESVRPAKRRKIESQGLHASWRARHEAYQKAWREQKQRIDAELSSINFSTVQELTTFLDEAAQSNSSEAIPTAILSTGPDTSSHTSVIQQLSRTQNAQARRVFISISATTGANLKALLKATIQKATSRNEGIDDEEDDSTFQRKGAKLLNYDLQILADYVREKRLQQVAIAIQDTEAFDSDLLSELIELLGCWLDRIPFAFLFTVATSLDVLQQRLSRGAIKCLKGQLFDVAPSEDEVERAFEAIANSSTSLWIGPELMSTALERQSDYIQSIDSFVGAAQYAYMSAYYGNALSIFLDSAIKASEVSADHFEALRNLDSFRDYCRGLLDNNAIIPLRALLDSDDSLFKVVGAELSRGGEALANVMIAVEVVRELQLWAQGSRATVPSKSKLYCQAMANKLAGSSLVRSLLLSTRKAPSDAAMRTLTAVMGVEIPKDLKQQCAKIKKELTEMVMNQPNIGQTLRSEDDIKNSTLRTTVVAQKVELSKQKSTLSKQDAAYTALLRRFTDLLEEYLNKTLIDPKSLLFHEIFLYDLKSPHRETFTPRPRHAIERALAAPHDYLDCSCCAPEQGDATLAASQPATAVLYQLYLESGSLINVSDLWQAFQAVLGDSEQTEEQQMALFLRALAEMRYLGLVKGTRKRADHIAKVAWKGL
ncbi:Origin recognition complex subunit 3 [Vermiconidia calcicola]|uniref:Origin recognition complex subunit 3 n=1 Tax=Vermiconidia calcicola TaxID=1690605 RepID=A0ACC3NN91_9PEZI|nr:Origin recognition complex subunit 3 [Vermiconidia calcicola]